MRRVKPWSENREAAMSQQPIPVQTLSYGVPSREGPAQLLRLAAWTAIVYGSVELLQELLAISAVLSSSLNVSFPPGQIAVAVAGVAIDAGMLAGAIQCLCRARAGPSVLMVACVAGVVEIAASCSLYIFQTWRSFGTDLTRNWLIANTATHLILREIIPILIFILARQGRRLV
jgi:hypothetical protein